MKSVVVNLSLFKASWVAAVFSAAASLPLAGTVVIAIAVAVHLMHTSDSKGELRLIALAAALGLTWESLLVVTGIVQYGAGSGIAGLAPYWIVAMWVLFATTINVGMRWLRKSLLLAAVAGAIGGPMSFFAGAKAGAVSFPDTTLALFIIGVGWAVLLPLLVKFAERGETPVAQPA